MSASAKVAIWLPKGVTHTFGIGHAGLKLKTEEGHKYYITWLNGRGGGSSGSSGSGGASTSQSREASRRVGFTYIQDRNGAVVKNPAALGSGQTFTFQDDMQANIRRFPELQRMGMTEVPPNYYIEIPAADLSFARSDTTPFGLGVRRVERFWKKLLNLPPGHAERRYGALSTTRNCNGVVFEALLAGMLDLYATPPDNILYQDARTLLRWVEKAKGRIDEMNHQYQEISRKLVGLPGLSSAQRSIPTLEQWKKDSSRNVAFYARRIEQVARLDELIPAYHKAKKEGKATKALKILLSMQFTIYDHLARKPQSDRRPAVLALAQRVLAVMRDDFVAESEKEQVLTLVPMNGQLSENEVLV